MNASVWRVNQAARQLLFFKAVHVGFTLTPFMCIVRGIAYVEQLSCFLDMLMSPDIGRNSQRQNVVVVNFLQFGRIELKKFTVCAQNHLKFMRKF